MAKTKLSLTCIIAFLLVAVLAGGAKARNNGRYIAWTIEQYDGRRWTELSARPGRDSRCDTRDNRSRGDCDDSYPQYGDGHRPGDGSIGFREFSVKPTLGKKYRIKITNLTQCRLAVAVDIDGKNSINSRDVSGTTDDAKWVLDRNTTIDVSGFQSSSKTAMEFYWTDRDDAHSDRADKLGAVKMYVYFENGSCARETLEPSKNSSPGRSLAREAPGATGAGNEIYNPVHTVNFSSYSRYPLEKVSVTYDRQSHPDTGWNTNSYSNRCYTGIGVEGRASTYAGVYLDNVFRDSPAWNAGIRSGDRIVKAAGKNVNNIDELKNILKRLSPGDYVVIKYVHSWIAKSTGVTLDTICP